MMLMITFFSLILCSYLFTQWLISYSVKHQLLDVANHRSSHTTATPRIGGISFVVLISLYLIYDALFIEPTQFTFMFLSLLLPCLLVALTAIIDDLKSLSQKYRFFLYFCASGIAIYFLRFEKIPVGFSIALWLILALGFNWLINLFNFMDGIDGIAASEAIFVLFALTYFYLAPQQQTEAYKLLFCAAPIIGFLLLNWSPAKIFMGDAGSTFLGCLLGCLLINAINLGVINAYSAIILLGCFWVDASWTLTYRLFTGQRWHQAHRSHSYQILSRKLQSHSKVTLLYSLINLVWLFPLALMAQKLEKHALLITTICFLPLLLGCFIIGAGKKANN